MNIRTLLYAGLLICANTAFAGATDLEALKEGDMKKLMFSDPAPVGAASFTTQDGNQLSLADYEGKIVLLNFWATWCAPCRKEMPALDALQAEFGGEDFQVVTVATGRNKEMAIVKFFEEVGVENLPILMDPKMALSREMAVMGLPVTVLIDRQSQEIARMMGDADWASDSAKAIIAALIEETAE